MMKLTRTGIGLLTRQYRSVLKKCFLINVGLYALLAPAASLTTATAVAVTAMPNVAQADYPVHNVPAGTTVDKIDDAFTNNTITNVTGAYVYNSGTINYIDAVVSGNTSGSGHSLIYNNNAVIKNILGYYVGNKAQSTSSIDNGIVLFNKAGTIDKIDASFINNQMLGGSDPNGAIFTSGGIIKQLYGNFIGNSVSATTSASFGVMGAAAYLVSNVGDVDGLFIGNSSTNSGTTKSEAGAIYVENGTTDSLNGSFIKNFTSANSGAAYGGAISNKSTIGAIGAANDKALFIGNYAQSESSNAQGGAIYNAGTISGDINADFIGNYTDSRGTFSGGAIYSEGTISGKIIGNFIGNSATALVPVGGAVDIQSGSIGGLSGNFINNSISSSSGNSFGGAVYLNSSNTATTVDGLFLNNSAKSTNSNASNGQAWGGGLQNDAKINTLNANFINNSTITSVGSSNGGAIYNANVITNLTADFINNSATSTSGTARGGAIYNNGGTISNVTGEFKNNTTSTTDGTKAAGGAIYNAAGTMNITDSYFNGNKATGGAAQGGAIVNTGIMTITDTSFRGNSTNYDAGAIRNGEEDVHNATLTINSINKDVDFYGNNGVNSPVDLNTIYSTTNLNAAQGRKIVFNGHLGGVHTNKTASIININSDDVNKGGQYEFNRAINNVALNLYNNANVHFGNVRQLSGGVSSGGLNLGSLVNDANGGYLNFANANADQTQNFGELTLNGNLKLGLDSGEKIAASSATGEGGILFDYINYASTPAGNQISWTYADSGDAVINKVANSTATVNTPYQTFTGAAVKNGNVMNVTLSNGTENLAGFLHNNTTDTSYDMSRDEQMLVNIDTMAGTTKTVNANGHNIIGNQHAGVTLADGQTLTINDANVEGFYKEGNGAVIFADNSQLYVNDTTFRNNFSSWGALYLANNSTTELKDVNFYNNVANSSSAPAAIRSINSDLNVYAQNKDVVFEGNIGSEGSAIKIAGNANTNIIGQNGHKVIFSNNENSGYGTVFNANNLDTTTNIQNAEFNYNSNAGLVNRGNVVVSDTIFKGNTAQNGGGLYNYIFQNSDTTYVGHASISDSTFENNTATESGGAIYNAGTMSVENSTFKGNMANEGGAIYNAEGGQMTIIGSTFEDNYSEASGTDDIKGGGAIKNEGYISKIGTANNRASFVNNIVYEAEEGQVHGAAINSAGNIGSIYADFSDNLVRNEISHATGGAISFVGDGSVNKIEGNFTNNRVIAKQQSRGGALYFSSGSAGLISGVFTHNSLVNYETSNTGLGGAIGSGGAITSIVGDFIENEVIYQKGSAWGGAIFQEARTIKSIDGKFIRNRVVAQSTVRGGAIYNGNIVENTIEKINGVFEGNNATSTDGDAQGGAIFNNNVGTITSIGTADNHAKFEGNYVQANTGSAYGGAIYNAGTIDNIYADFKDNYAISAGGKAEGGAIYNSGTIKNLTGRFEGNNGAKGSAIKNTGNMKITDSLFTSDNATSYAIGIDGGNTIIDNSIFSDISVVKTEASAIYAAPANVKIKNTIFKNNNPHQAVTYLGGFNDDEASDVNSIIQNTLYTNNNAISGTSALLTRGSSTVIDSSFINNKTESNSYPVGRPAVWNIGKMNFIADNSDIIFRNNSTMNSSNKYWDVNSNETVNLNATSGHSIDFGGKVDGNVALNINKSGLTYTDLKDDGTFDTETKNITQQGGDYIFRNEVSGQTMNLYNGANVQLRQLHQADGTTSYGNLSLTGFTSTGAGNILDTGNGRVDTSGQLALGTTTLNANTNLRLDVNLASAMASAGDLLSGTWSSGSGNFVIDSINILNTGVTPHALINNDTLKSHIAMASTYHTFEQDYKDRYTVEYSNGYLNFNQNKTGTLNLVGYLSNASSTATTPYDMTFDEPVLRNIGDMTGTTKTVNAGDYTINGNGFAGVTVNPGQTLNIDGGVWEGFQQNAIDTSTADGVKTVNINNSTFRYNTTIGREGGPAIDNNIGSKTTIVDSQFIQNQILGESSGGAIWNSAELTIKAENRNVEFQGNSAPSSGAIGNYGAGTTTINATGGDVVFKNNTAGKNGGAIYSSGTLNINATGGDVIFKNNEAGTQGGAIYNAGTLDISGTSNHKVIFDGNTSSLQGGAIYSPNGTSAISPVLSVDNAIFRNNRVYSDTDNTWGGAIRYSDTGNTISKLNADFINNSAESSAINYVEGGAVNIAAAIITEMNSNFTGNYVKSTYTGGGTDKVTGGAFFLWGPNSVVRNLTGIYSSNYAQAASSLAGGGAIYLMDGSSIDNLSATFTSNYALSASSDALGGAIYMAIYSSPSYLGGKISNVSNTTFTSNYAETTGKNAYGGAIANKYQQIGSINADFTGNYAKSTGEYKAGAGGMVISGDTTDNVGSGRAYGGAIFNLAQVTKDDSGNITGVVENTGVIDSISGNFKDNYVYSENGPAAGAAIYNEYGTIGQIGSADNKALFEGNKIYNIGTGFGMAGATEGGTIYNVKGTIGDIYADFTNNFGKAPDITAGTALSNFDGSVGNIVGNFTDNEMENSENGHGTLNNRAFSSVASITSIVGNFINNSIKTNKDGYGGAIMNYKITGDAANIAHIGTIEGTFENNGVTAERYVKGGAIANLDNDASVLTAVIDSVSGTFKNNYIIATGTELVEAFGGAIFNTDLISNIQNSSFVGNSVRGSTGKVYGGAIKNDGTIGTLDGDSKLLADNTGIINTSFEGNYVRGNDESAGGAIYNSGNINLSALQSDVNFWNNKANDRYNDIYNSGTMNFNADQNKTMSFGGSIEGTGAININTGATNGGTYVFKSGVSAGNVVVGSADSGYAPATLSFEKATQEDGSITNGTFDVASLTINGDGNSLSTRNDKVDTNSATTLTLNNALNMQIDGDLQSHTGDSIAVSNLTAAAPKSLRLTAMNFTTDPDVTTLSKTDTVDVNITGENDILAQNNAYTLASTNPDDTTEEQIEQAYLDNLTSSSRNYNKTYAFRSAKLMTSGNNQTYVQYGDAITLKWLYENYINGWSGGNYILNNVTDGGNPDSTHLTVGQALTALDSALGKNATYDFGTESVADVLVNNYYTKLMKKDEKFDTNEGIMDVKSLKKDTNSSQGRIIKGVSAFPSNLCAYPFDTPHTANDNHKSVIVMSAKHDVTIFGRLSDNTATTTKQAA